MEEQQEMYRVMTHGVPQNVRQLISMLKALKRHAEGKTQQEISKQNEIENIKELRARMGEDTPDEMIEQLKNLPQSERQKIALGLKEQLRQSKYTAGEKDLDVLLRDGKAIAQPQLLDEAVNLEQLKNQLTDKGLQFHIEPSETGKDALYFFAKDKEVFQSALDSLIDDITKDPRIVSTRTIKQEIDQTVKKQKAANEKEIDKATQKVANATTDATKKATEEVAKEVTDLFDVGI